MPVRVRPGASRTAVGGAHAGRLVVAVTARPVDGAATRQVTELVARAFDVRRREVVVVTGATSRDKVLEVRGDPDVLRRRFAALVGG